MTPLERETWLDGLRVFRQSAWTARFPGLVQGVTGRADGLDFSLPAESLGIGRHESTGMPAGSGGWDRLLAATGMAAVARCRQVHGKELIVQDGTLTPGAHMLGEADALVTRERGVLLAVTVADCVPVFVVDPESRQLGLAHAGWRGTAAGVVEGTLQALYNRGSRMSSLHVHLGPAICGRCYEVGPEVIAALGGSAEGPGYVDLRRHIARIAIEAGVDDRRLTVSNHCSRCEPDAFFSYRGGDRGHRMCAYLGWPSS
ncbi:MAG: polyphenol oxidase family protein [Gemmatimonadales bacterium]|jgi:YfiH family protein